MSMIPVPPNVPSGQSGKELLARLAASHALAGLGVDDYQPELDASALVDLTPADLDIAPIYRVTGTTSAPNSGGSGPTWWQQAVTDWGRTGQQILLNQNQPRGTYTQTGPGGTIRYVQPEGNASNIPFAAGAFNVQAGIGSGSMMPILLLGAGLVAVMLVMNRR